MTVIKSDAPPYIPSIISAQDITIFKESGMGQRIGFGERIALIIVDVTRAFVEDKFSTSCGKAGKQAVEQIRILLKKVREKRLPVFYTKFSPFVGAEAGRWPEKGTASKFKDSPLRKEDAHVIVPAIAPQKGEFVITKAKPSAFFGTQIVSLLNYFSIDTLIITGLVTSGCVRATVVDAFSYNYRVIVPIECVADRGEVSHQVSLFDLDMKHADVIPLSDVIKILKSFKD